MKNKNLLYQNNHIPTLKEIMIQVDKNNSKNELDINDKSQIFDYIKGINDELIIFKDIVETVIERIDILEERINKYENKTEL